MMPHTFLSLGMDLIPQSTKDNVPTFWQGLFSNDNSRMLMDGRNSSGELVHPQATLNSWLQWCDNPQEKQDLIISSAIEYTVEQINLEQADIGSIWYAVPSEEL